MEEFFPIFLMIGTNLRRSILETSKEKLGNENVNEYRQKEW